MTRRDYRISSLADSDMRQWAFERRSGLPAGYFDKRPWYRPTQDAIVFWIVLAVGLLAVFVSH